jgi:transcriptional regulator with XRE-family HTH domain
VADAGAFTRVCEAETLRQVVRRELWTSAGQRTLAREIGVHRSTLRKFASGQSQPEALHFGAIREWAADRRELHIPLPLVGFAILAEDLPPRWRPESRRRLAELLSDLYIECGEGIPTWVSDELRGLG